jgi:hypothetical protein
MQPCIGCQPPAAQAAEYDLKRQPSGNRRRRARKQETEGNTEDIPVDPEYSSALSLQCKQEFIGGRVSILMFKSTNGGREE